MSQSEVERLRAEVEVMVRQMHHYGYPPDPRLQCDVDTAVEDVLDRFDSALAAKEREVVERCARIAWGESVDGHPDDCDCTQCRTALEAARLILSSMEALVELPAALRASQEGENG